MAFDSSDIVLITKVSLQLQEALWRVPHKLERWGGVTKPSFGRKPVSLIKYQVL